jgi:hypothetical protein
MSTQELLREIDRTQQKVSHLQNKLLHYTKTDEAARRRKSAVLLLTGGALKRKIKTDPITWQKSIRKEWDSRSKA